MVFHPEKQLHVDHYAIRTACQVVRLGVAKGLLTILFTMKTGGWFSRERPFQRPRIAHRLRPDERSCKVLCAIRSWQAEIGFTGREKRRAAALLQGRSRCAHPVQDPVPLLPGIHLRARRLERKLCPSAFYERRQSRHPQAGGWV